MYRSNLSNYEYHLKQRPLGTFYRVPKLMTRRAFWGILRDRMKLFKLLAFFFATVFAQSGEGSGSGDVDDIQSEVRLFIIARIFKDLDRHNGRNRTSNRDRVRRRSWGQRVSCLCNQEGPTLRRAWTFILRGRRSYRLGARTKQLRCYFCRGR